MNVRNCMVVTLYLSRFEPSRTTIEQPYQITTYQTIMWMVNNKSNTNNTPCNARLNCIYLYTNAIHFSHLNRDPVHVASIQQIMHLLPIRFVLFMNFYLDEVVVLRCQLLLQLWLLLLILLIYTYICCCCFFSRCVVDAMELNPLVWMYDALLHLFGVCV